MSGVGVVETPSPPVRMGCVDIGVEVGIASEVDNVGCAVSAHNFVEIDNVGGDGCGKLGNVCVLEL